jgi:hypothetical protein
MNESICTKKTTRTWSVNCSGTICLIAATVALCIFAARSFLDQQLIIHFEPIEVRQNLRMDPAPAPVITFAPVRQEWDPQKPPLVDDKPAPCPPVQQPTPAAPVPDQRSPVPEVKSILAKPVPPTCQASKKSK